MISEDLKIEIRPIPPKKEVLAFSSTIGPFAQPKTVGPSINLQTRKFVTGLTPEDLTRIAESGLAYDLSNNFKEGEPHPFWDSTTARIDLLSTPQFLWPGKNLLHLIQWRYLSNHTQIYKSEQEMLEGGKNSATHYMYDEGEENSIKSTAIERHNRLIQKYSSLSLKRKRDVVLIIYGENTDTKDETYLTVKLHEISNSKEHAPDLERLLDASAAEIDVTALIKRAIRRNIIKKMPNGYYYFDTPLGLSESEIKTFLKAPENNHVYVNIIAKLEEQ